jgi:hypothetical protein
MLDYHNPANVTANPFVGAALRFVAGVVLAAVMFWICVRTMHASSDGLLLTGITAIIAIPTFQAVWAIMNFSGAPLVERHWLTSVTCGIGVFLVPAVTVAMLPPWMVTVSIPGVILLLLLPVVLTAVAGRLVFRRVAEPGRDGHANARS